MRRAARRRSSQRGQLQPDLVLLDLTMPGMDGLTALPKIREEAPDCEVVVLTASDAEENLLAAIRGGAAGYLLKTEPPEQIATFLRGVVARRGGALRRRRTATPRSGPRRRPPGRDPGGDHAHALRARGRGSAPPRRAPGHGRDRPAAVHLGAHGPLAREEPPARSSACRRGARRSSVSRPRAASASEKPSSAASTSDGSVSRL